MGHREVEGEKGVAKSTGVCKTSVAWPAQLARIERADVAPVEAHAAAGRLAHLERFDLHGRRRVPASNREEGMMFTHLVVHPGDRTKGEGAQLCRVETRTDGWLPAD